MERQYWTIARRGAQENTLDTAELPPCRSGWSRLHICSLLRWHLRLGDSAGHTKGHGAGQRRAAIRSEIRSRFRVNPFGLPIAILAIRSRLRLRTRYAFQ